MLYMASYNDADKENKTVIEHETGRKLLAYGLQKEFGIGPNQYKVIRGEHGKPCLEGFPYVHFNISHGGGKVVCAIAQDPVGIDVEEIRAFNPKVAKKILTVSEQMHMDATEDVKLKQQLFFQYWTLKESYVKATGIGLGQAFNSFGFTFTQERPVAENCPGYRFGQQIIDGRYVVSVCRKSHPEDGGNYNHKGDILYDLSGII